MNVAVIDRVDVDAMFKPVGNEFESPNLLGCIKAVTGDGPRHYAMSLLTGLPLVELKATAAHEFSHAWVGENVSPAGTLISRAMPRRGFVRWSRIC